MKKIIITATFLAMFVLGTVPTYAQIASNNTVQPDQSIRPFHIRIPDAKITDLKARLRNTKWPDKELVDNETQGVELTTMKSLADYWLTKYDWRKIESKLNSYPQFTTNIDGVDIHFIHVRSKNKNALPIIITHGWPGSVIEQLKIIEPLTNPEKFGGKKEDAFDVVIPSIPGHGFSGKPTELGWNPVRVAKAWITLMGRLGYNKYVAQGGDWGNAISENMALIAPKSLLGIHTNMAATVPSEISQALAKGVIPTDLSPDEKNAFTQLDFFYKKGLGYANEMSLRPQTLYAIDDSPIGLAAWMLDHDDRSQKLITRVFAGQQEGLSKDDILDNISLYWFTNTGISSARLYWEASQGSTAGFFDPRGLKIPVAVSAFPDEIYAVPKTWAQRAYPNLIYFNKLEKGGHFAAWEQPELFTKEMRNAFKALRSDL
ncbi:multidrug MFS transporter [Chryseobacterium gallinarum]|uniref:Multidrug MFS transporter n=2 Tax=Chryseobacterium gallinarum TaxID=1324352 RepID=A0A0G3M9R3_CHRGL|nr:multidrug MFS transporter [Chryseobacterium gallinarum]